MYYTIIKKLAESLIKVHETYFVENIKQREMLIGMASNLYLETIEEAEVTVQNILNVFAVLLAESDEASLVGQNLITEAIDLLNALGDEECEDDGIDLSNFLN